MDSVATSSGAGERVISAITTRLDSVRPGYMIQFDGIPEFILTAQLQLTNDGEAYLATCLRVTEGLTHIQNCLSTDLAEPTFSPGSV